MAKRKPLPADTQDAAPAAPAEGTVSLRLRQNHFVRGVFTPAGTVLEFPAAEANRRLSTTQLWDKA